MFGDYLYEVLEQIHVFPLDADALEEMGHGVTYGTNFHISVSAESEKETDRIFNALAAGGKITVPLEKMFWGAYFGMLTDKFGVQWMVSFDDKREKLES